MVNSLMKSKLARVGLSLLLVVFIAIALFPLQSAVHEFYPTFYIGMVGEAGAETADYECDGTDDHVQVQAALDALPSGGGCLYLLSGTYSFGATVTRAIDNVTTTGNGYSSYITYNASTAVFSDGGQSHWVIKNIRTDAGGVTLTGTGSGRLNMWVGTTHYDDFDIRERIIEAFACSFTPDSGGSLSCEDVDFGDMTLSVVQMTTDEILEVHLLTPPGYGSGGTLTYSVKFGWRTTTTETSDTVTFAIKAGDTIANCEADSWNTSQDTWIQADEIHWSDEITVAVNGSPTAGEDDVYFQIKCDTYTSSVAPHLDKIVMTFECY